LLNSMLHGSVAVIIKRVINTNFKHPFGWVTGKFMWPGSINYEMG